VLFDVLGWTFIAVAVVNAVPKVRRLLADPAGRDRAGSRARSKERSKDWSSVRQSVVLAGTGLTQLQLPALRTGSFRWPLDVSLAPLATWELAAMYRSRKNRRAEAGPAEGAPEPATGAPPPPRPAAGLPLPEAVGLLRRMVGPFRLPQALQRVDALSRGAPPRGQPGTL
jgi:hypothetical protein